MGSVPRTGFRRGLADLYNYLDNEIPLAMKRSGNVYYVCNRTGGGGSDSAGHGTFDLPFATIDYAIGQCTASRGDFIAAKAGHDETLSAAGAIACDVAGITIVGLGFGNNRPILRFAATAATVTVSAANVTISNIVCIATLDSVVSGFVVSAGGCTLDIEWQDSTSAIEAVTAILGGTAADNLNIRLRYLGQTAGDACVAPIQLNGTNEALIDVNFYGKASTAVVNFITTLCTGIRITGNMYVSGTTNGSKLCVDTIGSSTWWLDVFDGAAGARMSGGSGAGVASDDASVIAANQTISTVDGSTNVLSRDVVGNKSDAGVQTVGTSASIMAYLKAVLDQLSGAAGLSTYPAAAAAANAVSIAEVLRYISEYELPRTAATGAITCSATFTVGAATLFTVTGNIRARVWAVFTTAAASTLNNGTISIGSADSVAAFIAATTANGTNFVTNSVWAGDTSPTVKAKVASNGSLNWVMVGNSTNIIATIATNAFTAGLCKFYCDYIPMDSSSTCVAAL